METLKFKTNIKCDGCIANVTPFLNNLKGVRAWHADIADPDKIMTVKAENVTAGAIKDALAKAGYNAEPI